MKEYYIKRVRTTKGTVLTYMHIAAGIFISYLKAGRQEVSNGTTASRLPLTTQAK